MRSATRTLSDPQLLGGILCDCELLGCTRLFHSHRNIQRHATAACTLSTTSNQLIAMRLGKTPAIYVEDKVETEFKVGISLGLFFVSLFGTSVPALALTLALLLIMTDPQLRQPCPFPRSQSTSSPFASRPSSFSSENTLAPV